MPKRREWQMRQTQHACTRVSIEESSSSSPPKILKAQPPPPAPEQRARRPDNAGAHGHFRKSYHAPRSFEWDWLVNDGEADLRHKHSAPVSLVGSPCLPATSQTSCSAGADTPSTAATGGARSERKGRSLKERVQSCRVMS
eukprot:4812500-Pleurochrysis_carterae.AAC.2